MSNAIESRLTGALSGVGAGPAAPRGTSDELRENFMTLLVTQLKNQDPLKPMENAELTSQLAQINTVSGIDSLNDTLSGITSQIEAGQALQATELIGKGVLVPGERLLVGKEGAATPFGVELDSPAAQMTAKIRGADGQIVQRLDLGAMDAGVQTFAWDGEMESGEKAPDGAYSVEIEAQAEDGSAVESVALNYAVVGGISTGQPGGPRLDLGGVAEQVRLDDVRQIL